MAFDFSSKLPLQHRHKKLFGMNLMNVMLCNDLRVIDTIY